MTVFRAFVCMRRLVRNFDPRQRIKGGAAHLGECNVDDIAVHFHLSPHFFFKVIDATLREALLLRSLIDDVVDESAIGTSGAPAATLNLLLS
jgi:hypothetical protein